MVSEPSLKTASAHHRFGHYEIHHELGSGGMGSVFEATQVYLGKRVALKVIRPDVCHDPTAVERFFREMASIGKLRHENVVEAFDAGTIDGVHYLAMQLVDGVNVGQLIDARGALPVNEACEIVRQAALGLHHAHEAGMVHRDVKPANLLCDNTGRVLLTDLGLAQLTVPIETDLTGENAVVGTPDYVAPEQIDRRPLGPTTDVYALGCTLYRMLTGRVPFGAPTYPTSYSKITGHLRDAPPRIEDGGADVPAGLVRVVSRMMAKDPNHRYADARAVAAAVAPWAKQADLSGLVGSLRGAVRRSLAATEAVDGVQPAFGSTVTYYGPTQRLPFTSRTNFKRLSFCIAGAVAASMLFLISWLLWKGVEPTDGVAAVASIGPAARGNDIRTIARDDEAVKLRATFQDLPADAIQSLKWYPLFTREPLPLVWDSSRGQNFKTWDPELEQMFVRTEGYTYLELAKTPFPSYTFNVDVRQTDWDGGFGVYVGMREGNAQDEFVGMRIAMEKNVARRSNEFPLKLTAYADQLFRRPNPGTTVDSAPSVRPIFVERPDRGVSSLEVTVVRHRVAEIRWNGRKWELPQDATPDLIAVAGNGGSVGLYVHTTAAAFQNARIMIHSSRQPPVE